MMPRPSDYWRLASRGRLRAFKEWQHLIVLAPEFTLIANFSVTAPAHPSARWRARVVVLAHTDRWTGWVESFELDASAVAAGERTLTLGRHRLAIRAVDFGLTLDAPDHGVYADLALAPRTAPLVVHNQLIAPGRRLHWRVQPRLRVQGTVTVGGRHHRLTDGDGYHDHNWGQFAWGDDFRWEWGIVLPDAGDGGDWAALYSGLLNAARTVRTAEQVLLWRGRDNTFVAANGDAASSAHGTYRAPPDLRLPPVMALVQPRRDRDLPGHLEVTASNGRDRIAIHFATRHDAQILVPSERDPLGIVTIHECLGPARVEGQIAGEPHAWRGRGVFEFVR